VVETPVDAVEPRCDPAASGFEKPTRSLGWRWHTRPQITLILVGIISTVCRDQAFPGFINVELRSGAMNDLA
jgi:hypothetical protein